MILDRPKDKASPIEPPRAALPARGVGGADVASYLRQHPDFLIEHADLLEVLTPPTLRRGERVVDMQHFMLERQRAEIERLRAQQRSIVAATRANLASQNRIHGAILALLAAQSFEQLIQIVTGDL